MTALGSRGEAGLTHARRSSSRPLLFFGQRAGSALRREGSRRLSPQYYANQGYVSHVTHDFGSILKFHRRNFPIAFARIRRCLGR
jgi:hypothetical protein